MKLTKIEFIKLISWFIILLFLILANVALRVYEPNANSNFPSIWAVAISIVLLLDVFNCFLIRRRRRRASALILVPLLIISYLAKITGAIFSFLAILGEGGDPRVAILHIIVSILFLVTFILHLTFDIKKKS